MSDAILDWWLALARLGPLLMTAIFVAAYWRLRRHTESTPEGRWMLADRLGILALALGANLRSLDAVHIVLITDREADIAVAFGWTVLAATTWWLAARLRHVRRSFRGEQ